MTQDEARDYCEQRGIGPHLGRAERMALSPEDGRMFMVAFSTGDPSAFANQEWVGEVQAKAAARIEDRERAQRLRDAAGL